jgi:creatinine amidohydrolase/Fe(II)-dependent formamide hydrolase-like protein
MAHPASRLLGDLTFPEVSRHLKKASILLLPLGAFEQHGPHLPLNTDTVIAEELTRRIVAKWGDAFDLWQLPTLSISLSREHDWAPGTLCLTIEHFIALIRDIANEITRSLPARNLLIVNGHGGNRGVLETLARDLGHERELNVGVIHPFDLTKLKSSGPDVHGGKSETSVMMALAPRLVRKDRITRPAKSADKKAIEALVFERGTTWPWRSDDPRLGYEGVIGEAHGASPEFGRRIVDSIVAEARWVFERMLETQRLLYGGPAVSAPVRVDPATPIAPRLRRRVTPARTSRRSGSQTPRPPRKKS